MRPAFAEQLNPDNAVEAPYPGKKILVVDDNQIVLKTLSLGLGARGYEMITAADASEAIAAVHVEKPDLILLDIFFPPDVVTQGGMGWDGFRMIEWFHRMDEGRHIPTIIISSADPIQYKDRCLAAGVSAFLQKPLKTRDVVDAIQNILGNKSFDPALNFEV